MKNKNKFLTSAILLCALFVLGCGGGTGGTGLGDTTRTFEGTVLDVTQQPVRGAEVVVLETGDNAVTDQNGEFLIKTEDTGESATFEIRSGTMTSSVLVSDLPDEASAVIVDLRLDKNQSIATTNNLSITVKVGGDCDLYFENKRTIRQSNAVPEGKRCPIRITARDNGQPVGDIGFILQRRRCQEGAKWVTLDEGQTSSTTPKGVGETEFIYKNSAEFCVYRVIAPYKTANLKDSIFEIHTFKKQEFDNSP